MKQNNSAIMQMIMGKRGCSDKCNFSKEYNDALKTSIDKIEEFEKRLKVYPELFKLFCEMQEASSHENAIFIDEVYKEAFAFGLAMGQEVFDN